MSFESAPEPPHPEPVVLRPQTWRLRVGIFSASSGSAARDEQENSCTNDLKGFLVGSATWVGFRIVILRLRLPGRGIRLLQLPWSGQVRVDPRWASRVPTAPAPCALALRVQSCSESLWEFSTPRLLRMVRLRCHGPSRQYAHLHIRLTYMTPCVYVCVCVRTYASMYVCMFVCLYVRT